MKKQNIYAVSMLMVGFILIVASCKSGASGSSDYSNAADKFSIAFPSGSSGVETKTDSVKYAKSARTYSKSFDNRSDNFRNYEVQVLDVDSSAVTGKTPRQIQEIALNGWEKEPETKIKDIKVQNLNGIDSIRTVEVGPAKMSFREVVFWSEAEKKLYVVKVAATKKDNLTAPEAEAFVNSFKLGA